jgi:HAD domain in Swiss Army Knife RNA repair proteins
MTKTTDLLIFLDFDGVLRRREAQLYQFEKPLLAAFENAVRRIGEARIVITSSWREVIGLARLRELFSPDVAARIVGAAPFGSAGRYGEILAYLAQNGAVGRRYIVVDDDPQCHPPDARLLLVDPAKGFSPEDAQRLVEMGGS